MPIPTLMPSPRQRFVDNVGLPLANGMVFTFAAGTSDKLAAFQDPDGLIPHENPIRLDIRGEATIYWLGNYKVDVRTALGIQLPGYPVDNFNAIDTAAATSGGIAAAIAGLFASAGSSLIGWIQAGVGALKRTVQDKLRERVSVKDFGAKGDGTTDDVIAIQACIDYCAGDTGKQVYFPASNYYITAPLKVPRFANIIGDGPTKSRINLQGKAYVGEILINADASGFSFITIKEMGFRGGSHGIWNKGSTQEQLTLENCSFELQTAASIRSDRDWQINSLSNVQFYICFQGIYVVAGFSNHNTYHACQFNSITGASYRCESSNEVNNFVGCRFEAGGLVGNITIQVANNRNTNFIGCYFENTHNILLNETTALGTSFDKCHFTGAITGTSKFGFNSDAEVHFGTNSWGTVSDGAPRMRISGDNGGKLGNNNTLVLGSDRNQRQIVSPWVTCPASLQKDLITITKVQSVGASTNIQTLTGILRVTYYGIETGGFGKSFSRHYHVTAYTAGLAVIVAKVLLISGVDDASGATLVVQPKSGATGSSATIEAVFTGLVPSTQVASSLQYSFEYTGMSVAVLDYFNAKIA